MTESAERFDLYKGMAYLAQASLGRMAPNVQALALAWVGGEPVVGLRLDPDSAAAREAFAEIVLELDGYYDHSRTVHTDLAVAPNALPVREWWYVYVRYEAAT